MNTVKLNKLPQELVNQIAAGEVIERPSSIVKELVDNSIDAKASEIMVRVVNGGIDLIEVSDNGIGIPKENIEDIFQAHTTSKISSLEDLNNLLTMGFRGEALSTIVSVANIRLISKYEGEDIANEISFREFQKQNLKSAARESGTCITVENIFNNIPARKKFLKTAQTEYRKILDILIPYFLIYPNISFTVIKDGKQVYSLKSIPNTKAGSIEKERIQHILKDEYANRMLKLFYDGSGIKISGLIGHPSDHIKRTSNQYIFVNRRPIWDSGIAKSILQGYERYIPHGEKVPFVINIDINPDLVDVNVHPRKEEVRFLNPFRVYTAVQDAVNKALVSVTTYKADISKDEYIPLVNNKEYASRDITFNNKPQSSTSVRDSLLFSKELLSESNSYIKPTYIQENTDTEFKPVSLNKDIPRNVYQIFNKYIILEFDNKSIWIVDQHAAAERITFEKLKKKHKLDTQKFLVPISVSLSDTEIEMFDEFKEIFTSIGFDISLNTNSLEINSAPVEFVNTDFKSFIDEILSLGEGIEDIKKEISRLTEDILATMACHGSVRSGQYLHREEMLDIYNKLIACDNPYSCPHGRPAVWKLSIEDIDKNFERTY